MPRVPTAFLEKPSAPIVKLDGVMSAELTVDDASASINNAVVICLLKKAKLGVIAADVLAAAVDKLVADKMVKNKDDKAAIDAIIVSSSQPLLELLHAGLELGHERFDGWLNAVKLPNGDARSLIKIGAKAKAAPFDLTAAFKQVTGLDYVPTQWYKYRAAFSASIPIAKKVISFLGAYTDKFIPELYVGGRLVFEGKTEYDSDHGIPTAALAKIRVVLGVYEPSIDSWYQGNKALSELGGESVNTFRTLVQRYKKLCDDEKDVSNVESIDDIARVAADTSGSVVKELAKASKKQRFVEQQFEKLTGQPARVDGMTRDEVTDAIEDAKEMAVKAKLYHRNPLVRMAWGMMTPNNIVTAVLFLLVVAMFLSRGSDIK